MQKRREQATPHFDQLSQSRVAWGEVRKALDEPTIESYENAVNRAFADYEALLKDYFWSLGLISAVEKHLYVGDGSGQQQNTPARSLQPRTNSRRYVINIQSR